MAPPRYPCVRCGSTNFEEVNAIWYCYNGHDQEGGQQVGEDDDDFGRFGKVNRQKEAKNKQKVVRVYRGAKGFRLFLKAWQYVLWKQCYQLIHDHNLPETLWDVVRELWTLRLTKLTPRLEEADKAEQNQSSDLSTSNSEPDETLKNDTSYLKTSKNVTQNPTLMETVSLNYIGILALSHPTSLSTIYEYVRKEKICYIRAIRHVPNEMRERLAPEYRTALDTITIPTQVDLQLAVYRTTLLYTRAFEMDMPSINWILILMKYIQDLALPLEVFPAVRHLAEVLQSNFAYPKHHNIRRTATTYPEAQLMALLVVATKLLYPFDSDIVQRLPKSINEPAAVQMNWQAWLEEKKKKKQKNNNSQEILSPDKAIEVRDTDILRMPDVQLDQYMDWFQQTYAKEYEENDVHKQIVNMFPLQSLEQLGKETTNGKTCNETQVDRIIATQSNLQPRRVVAELTDHPSKEAETLLRPGQQYHQYLALDGMSDIVRYFHTEAAEYACLDVDSLLRACLSTEKKLLQYQYEQKRAKTFDEDEQE